MNPFKKDSTGNTDSNVNEIEKVIVKEGKTDDQLLSHAIKSLKNAERSQTKAQKVF